MRFKGLWKLKNKTSEKLRFPLRVTLAGREGKSWEDSGYDQNWSTNFEAISTRRKAGCHLGN